MGEIYSIRTVTVSSNKPLFEANNNQVARINKPKKDSFTRYAVATAGTSAIIGALWTGVEKLVGTYINSKKAAKDLGGKFSQGLQKVLKDANYKNVAKSTGARFLANTAIFAALFVVIDAGFALANKMFGDRRA